MPPLNPRSDFRDDGGTPAWRARRAAPIYDAAPAGFRGFRHRLRHVPFWRLAAFVAIWCLLGPWAYFIGALALGYLGGFTDKQAWAPATIWGGFMLTIFVSAIWRLLYSRTGR